MFDIQRQISTSSYTDEELFEIALNSLDRLIDSWGLELPKKTISSETFNINIISKNFSGNVSVSEGTLSIDGQFKSLFKLDKRNVQQLLASWIQETFHVTYDL